MNGVSTGYSSTPPSFWGFFSERQLFEGVSSSATSFLGIKLLRKATPIEDRIFFPTERTVNVERLVRFKLRFPLSFILEKDGPGFLVKCCDLPLYGYDKNLKKAIIKLKREIEDLYSELESEQNFSKEWKDIHSFLKRIIIKK